jgi:hypothetical protein
VYAVIARGMFRATEPLRYEMIDLAAKLLHNSGVSKAQKTLIESSLSDVHKAHVAWKVTFALFFLVITIPIHHFKTPKLSGVPSNMLGTFKKFQLRWIIATLANSPIAACIFVFLLMLLAAFTLSINTIFSVLMSRRGDKGDEGGLQIHA